MKGRGVPSFGLQDDERSIVEKACNHAWSLQLWTATAQGQEKREGEKIAVPFYLTLRDSL